MLNFSSEIEIDPRFEMEEMDRPEPIDKTRPEGLRKTLKEVKKDKRMKIFDEYRSSVARAIDMQENQINLQKGRRFVQFAENLVDNIDMEEQLKRLGNNTEAEKGFLLS